MTPIDNLREEMRSIAWYHSIDLGPGLGVTPGHCKDDATRLKYMKLPVSLVGMKVLDIGSWDGFFAFEAERRGAAEVWATDLWGEYEIRGHGLKNTVAGFWFARRTLNSKVQHRKASVYDLQLVGSWRDQFDLVLFPGVLYHLTDPLGALRSIYNVMAPGGLLILETHLDCLTVNRPMMAFYEGDECGRDETNWIGPNIPCVLAMLRVAGFVFCEFMGGINLDNYPNLAEINYARGAFHARKPR